MGAHQHSPRTIRINAQRENTSDKHSKCEVEEVGGTPATPPAAEIERNQSDTMQVNVELLFNLLWVVISAGLIRFWLGNQHPWADDMLRPSILYPVVSLTDDVLACTPLVRVEHPVRRCLQDGVESDCQAAFIMVGALFPPPSGSRSQIIPIPSPSMDMGTPRKEFLRILGSCSPLRA